MSNYTKATNFTAKDSLPSGNSGKIVKGAEIDTEFTAIASAISSKADSNSPTFTGTPTAPTATSNTNTTQIATTAFVQSLGGRIAQVVTQKFTNVTDTTSTTYVDTFATLSITPTSSTSKIFIIVEGMIAHFDYSGAGVYRLVRGSTVIVGDHYLWASNGFTQAPYQTWSSMTLHAIDEPSTTSSTTYKVQIKNVNAGSSYFGANDTNGTVFTLMEVLI